MLLRTGQLVVVVMTFPATILAAEQPTPVAWYDFKEGKGTTIGDRTGNGHDGRLIGGKFVRLGEGFALSFAKPGEYAECAAGQTFKLQDQISLEAWVYPQAIPWAGEPGIVGQGYGSFVLTYYTNGQCYWYIGGGSNNCHAPLEVGTWHHLVGTFDGTLLKLYVDGVLVACNTSKVAVVPEGKGLLIGTQTSSPQYSKGKTFAGLVGEVRLYRFVLSTDEVARRYRTSNLTHMVDLVVVPQYFAKQVNIEMALRGLGEHPGDTYACLTLLRIGEKQPLQLQRTPPLGPADRAETTMRLGDLAPGQYELRCEPLSAQGKPIGLPSAKVFTWPPCPSWPNMPREARILNNLVTELLNLELARAENAIYHFTNPREGWVFVTTAPRATVTLDGASLTSPEAMRWLPVGNHTLGFLSPTEQRRGRVIVRAIPTLGYCQHQANPQVAPFGPYDWGFLKMHVLKHCNLIVARADPAYKPYLQEWKKGGGKWVVHAGVPGLEGKPVTTDDVEKAWSENLGMTEPLADGIIVDEFSTGDQPQYAAWTEALHRLAANPRLSGRWFIPYGDGPMYAAKGSSAFIRATFDMGSPFANERYLPEQPTESAARLFLDSALRSEAEGWNKGTSEGVRRMLMNLGYFASPNESLDVNPGVDWRVYMDMQMQVLATDPTFFGLWGVQWYLSSYADEEQVRLGALLLRHYGIEGKTERLLKDPYVLAHLQNPDFAEGLAGWTVVAAEPGSITTGRMPGFSWLQGRYPPTSQGDAFLVMKRSAHRPNVVTQKIKGLQSGRLYTLRMFTADGQNLGKKRELAMSVSLDGVEVLPEKSFVYVIKSCYSHVHGKFNANHPAWFNYFFRVFRSRDREATITISDWENPGKAGGPTGQEIRANFVQIQPYLAE